MSVHICSEVVEDSPFVHRKQAIVFPDSICPTFRFVTTEGLCPYFVCPTKFYELAYASRPRAREEAHRCARVDRYPRPLDGA